MRWAARIGSPGFENEMPDPVYSDGYSPATFYSGAGKERTDVH